MVHEDLEFLISQYIDGTISPDDRVALLGAPGVREVAVRIVFDPPWSPDAMMSGTAKAALGWRR